MNARVIIRLGYSEGFSYTNFFFVPGVLDGLPHGFWVDWFFFSPLSSSPLLFYFYMRTGRDRVLENVDGALLLSGYISLSPLRDWGSASFCLGN